MWQRSSTVVELCSIHSGSSNSFPTMRRQVRLSHRCRARYITCKFFRRVRVHERDIETSPGCPCVRDLCSMLLLVVTKRSIVVLKIANSSFASASPARKCVILYPSHLHWFCMQQLATSIVVCRSRPGCVYVLPSLFCGISKGDWRLLPQTGEVFAIAVVFFILFDTACVAAFANTGNTHLITSYLLRRGKLLLYVTASHS